MADVRCRTIGAARPSGDPHLFPGWICCACKTYNDLARTACKLCTHAPCYRETPQ